MKWKRYIPLIILAILMTFAYFFGLGELFTYEKLKNQRATLVKFVSEYPVYSSVIFIIIYIISTALSVPGGSFLSIIGGFLFPQPLSTLFVVFGATVGATFIFLAAKTAFGETMKEKAGPMLNKMRKGFLENSASYLLFLRLVPAFPFWLVNLAPAFFSVKLSTFVWTTFIGIIPGAFVFTQTGAGLGSIFDSSEELSIETIFTTDSKIALLALALFALLPIIIKKLRKEKS